MSSHPFQRRSFIKSSTLSILGITTFGFASAKNVFADVVIKNMDGPFYYRYPAIDDDMVAGIVGASHGNFDKVKKMVNERPELAGASWDWGFGDFETALGAASHVGRRDIAEYLISKGARPDIFTFTMMGMLQSVKEIIETVPGIQSHAGPHGITLLAHAKNRLRHKDLSASDITNVNSVLQYLESLGNADYKPKSINITEDEMQMYYGEYRYGNAETEVLVVNQNTNKFLQLGRKESSGRGLTKVDEHTFFPAGAPSVKIIFKMKDDKAISLSIHEPQPLVTAIRI